MGLTYWMIIDVSVGGVRIKHAYSANETLCSSFIFFIISVVPIISLSLERYVEACNN
jgi:hypothetical protein